MDTSKPQVGLAAIAAAVAVLLVILYLLYHFTLAPKSTNISKENAPEYAKKAGMTDNPTGGGGGARPSYGQGAGYAGRPGGGGPPSYGTRPGGGAPNYGGR